MEIEAPTLRVCTFATVPCEYAIAQSLRNSNASNERAHGVLDRSVTAGSGDVDEQHVARVKPDGVVLGDVHRLGSALAGRMRNYRARSSRQP